jgi:hypothetical protein
MQEESIEEMDELLRLTENSHELKKIKAIQASFYPYIWGCVVGLPLNLAPVRSPLRVCAALFERRDSKVK